MNIFIGEDPGNVTFIGTIRSYLVADTQEPNEEDEDSNLQTVDRLLLGGELCDPYSGDGETTCVICVCSTCC